MRAGRPAARRRVVSRCVLSCGMIASLAVAAGTTACEVETVSDDLDDTDADEEPNPHATLVARIDLAGVCAGGASEVEMVAVQVACEPPPPAPCTMPGNPPLLASETASCADGGTVSLSRTITNRGRYDVQLVVDGDWDHAICLGAQPSDEAPVRVSQDHLDARTDILVSAIDGQPCDG